MLPDILAALRRGDTAAALASARAAVAAQPNSADAHHGLGLSLQRSGDAAGARAALERALELAPERADIQFSLALQTLAEGDTVAAEAGMRGALAYDPNQLPAYVALVHLALSRQDLDEAGRQLKLAQRVDPRHPQVRLAEGYLAQVTGDAERALACFTAAVEADPELPSAQVALGMAFYGRGMWPFAEQALANAVRLAPDNPSSHWSLVQARLRQGKTDEVLQAIEALLQRFPGHLPARLTRAELLLNAGREDEALADAEAGLREHPHDPRLIGIALAVHGRRGNVATPMRLLDEAVAAQPYDDRLWLLMVGATAGSGGDVEAVLNRWLEAAPESGLCLEQWARWFESRGQLDRADEFADRALALAPGLMASNLMKARAEIATDPAATAARMDRLLESPHSPQARRGLLWWKGLALDRMDQPAEAMAAWREMIRLPTRQLPLPKPVPASEAPPAGPGGAGLLLWAPPGKRLEPAFGSLRRQFGDRLLLDHLEPNGRGDGFGPLRHAPGDERAGTAARWRAAIEARGLDPATVLDVMAHVDGYTLAALDGAVLVAVLEDPRDLLLNWLVHGSTQNYLFLPDTRVTAEWLALCLEALAERMESAPDQVRLVRHEGDAPATAGVLQRALGTAEPVAFDWGELEPGQLSGRLPAGQWRRYAEVLADEFARLAPVAQRLGFAAA